MKKPREIWKNINFTQGLYEVSNLGKIRSFQGKSVRILKPSHQKSGYLQVTLRINNKSYYKWVHRLVAESFLKSNPDKPIVNHKDGNKKNNKVNNLEYCTSAENSRHAALMNLNPFGCNHVNSKLTHEDLKKVRRLLNEGILTHKVIASLYNVYRTAITRIANNKSYVKEIT